MLLDGFRPHRIGYTTVLGRIKWFRSQLAEHRKGKRAWQGTRAEYQSKLAHLVERLNHYKDLCLRPDYAREIAEAKRRKRRVQRRALPIRRTTVMGSTVLIGASGKREWVPGEVIDDHRAYLPGIVFRVKRKRFKTIRHLAYWLRRPAKWVLEAKTKAIEDGLITEIEWQASFRRPGRPRKGKPRGPYKNHRTTKFTKASDFKDESR